MMTTVYASFSRETVNVRIRWIFFVIVMVGMIVKCLIVLMITRIMIITTLHVHLLENDVRIHHEFGKVEMNLTLRLGERTI